MWKILVWIGGLSASSTSLHQKGFSVRVCVLTVGREGYCAVQSLLSYTLERVAVDALPILPWMDFQVAAEFPKI